MKQLVRCRKILGRVAVAPIRAVAERIPVKLSQGVRAPGLIIIIFFGDNFDFK